MQIFSNTNIDFIKWRWHALALSIAIIAAGVVLIAQRGLPLGIDFSGGTIVVYKFSGNPVGEDAVRKAIERVPGEKVVQRYGQPADNSILIRLPQAQGTEEGFGLEAGANALRDAVTAANLGKFEEISR